MWNDLPNLRLEKGWAFKMNYWRFLTTFSIFWYRTLCFLRGAVLLIRMAVVVQVLFVQNILSPWRVYVGLELCSRLFNQHKTRYLMHKFWPLFNVCCGSLKLYCYHENLSTTGVLHATGFSHPKLQEKPLFRVLYVIWGVLVCYVLYTRYTLDLLDCYYALCMITVTCDLLHHCWYDFTLRCWSHNLLLNCMWGEIYIK